MKGCITVLGLLAVSLSHAAEKTTIEFPLMGEEVKNHDVISLQLSTLNKKLKAKGLPGFPEVVVFSKTDLAWAKKIQARAEESGKALKRDIYAYNYGANGMYMHQVPESICYRGKPSEVVGIIQALMGVVFEEDQGLQAVRYGKKKIIFPDFKTDFFETNSDVREEDEENNPAEVRAWEKYDTKSDTVLLLSDLGPSGDGIELYSTEIKRCQ